jgi:hypothetical protein
MANVVKTPMREFFVSLDQWLGEDAPVGIHETLNEESAKEEYGEKLIQVIKAYAPSTITPHTVAREVEKEFYKQKLDKGARKFPEGTEFHWEDKWVHM